MTSARAPAPRSTRASSCSAVGRPPRRTPPRIRRPPGPEKEEHRLAQGLAAGSCRCPADRRPRTGLLDHRDPLPQLGRLDAPRVDRPGRYRCIRGRSRAASPVRLQRSCGHTTNRSAQYSATRPVAEGPYDHRAGSDDDSSISQVAGPWGRAEAAPVVSPRGNKGNMIGPFAGRTPLQRICRRPARPLQCDPRSVDGPVWPGRGEFDLWHRVDLRRHEA